MEPSVQDAPGTGLGAVGAGDLPEVGDILPGDGGGSGHCPNLSDVAEDALGKGKGLAKVPQSMRGESGFDSP